MNSGITYVPNTAMNIHDEWLLLFLVYHINKWDVPHESQIDVASMLYTIDKSLCAWFVVSHYTSDMDIILLSTHVSNKRKMRFFSCFLIYNLSLTISMYILIRAYPTRIRRRIEMSIYLCSNLGFNYDSTRKRVVHLLSDTR